MNSQGELVTQGSDDRQSAGDRRAETDRRSGRERRIGRDRPFGGADPPRHVLRAAGPSDRFRAVFKAFDLSDGLVRITRGLRHRQVREEGSGLSGRFAGRHGVGKHHVRDRKVHRRGLL